MRHEYLHQSNHVARNQNYYAALTSDNDTEIDTSNHEVHFAPHAQIRSFDPATISHSDTVLSCEGVLIPTVPGNPDQHSRDNGDVIIEPFSSQSDRSYEVPNPNGNSALNGTLSSF